MESDVQKSAFIHDVFISYSRKDKEFAKKLEKALEDYKPPKDLKIQQRNLDVFRDEEDFTGVEYQQSVAKHLKDSATLIVLCSPNSRKSKYVNDEIRLFAETNGAGNIIPILVSGIPNNEAKPGQEDQMAFPEALCEAMEMPLATDYRGFDLQKDKVNKGVFYGQWYTILANIYNISRSEIEQREKRRQASRRNWTIGIVSSIIAVLSVALVVTLFSRQEAVRQRNIAEERRKIALSRQLAAQALNHADDQLDLALLLSMEANRITDTMEARGGSLEVLEHNPHITAFLHGHSDSVFSIAFSPDGKTLASSSNLDNRIILWDVATRKPVGRPLIGQKHGVRSVAFSPDGKTLASGGCGDDRYKDEIRFWDVATRKPLGQPFTGHNTGVDNIAFSPNGKMLASNDWDGKIILWDVATRKHLDPLPTRHTDWLLSASFAFNKDGKTLASGGCGKSSKDGICKQGEIRLWDVTTRQLLCQPLKGHTAGVRSVAFSPNDKMLASGSEDNTIILWDVATCKRLDKPLAGHSAGVDSVAFSPNGKILASGSWDSEIVLWDVATRQPLGQPLTGHTDQVNSVAFSPDGKTLASGGQDNRIILWDVNIRQLLERSLKSDTNRVMSSAFSPDGKMLASGGCGKLNGRFCKQGEIRLWDVVTRKPLCRPLTEHTDWVSGVAFSPDSKTLVSGGCGKSLEEGLCKKGEIRLWDVSTCKLLSEPLPPGHEAGVSSIAFSRPDRNTLASCGLDNKIILWNLDTRKPLDQFSAGYIGWPESVAFSPDGKTLASGGWDNKVILWDVSTRQPIGQPLIGHDAGVYSVAFSPNGKILASGGCGDSLCKRGEIRLWDVDTRKPIGQSLTGHNAGVSSVAFSPDGKMLASTGGDKTILWDVTTQQPLVQLFTGHTGGADSVAFSPDGKTLISGGWNNIINLWDVSFDFELWGARACSIANRNLTYDEWQNYMSDEPYRKTCPNLPIHPSFIEAGRNLARAGNIEGAVTIFRKALELEPSLNLDPETEARRLELIGKGERLVGQGESLVKRGKVGEAIAAYREAQTLFGSTLEISAESLNDLCWYGSVWGDPAGVMDACNRAVALDPENGRIRDSRGVARALTGNINGAIEDFQTFINWADDEGRSQRQHWIDVLRVGQNPFTPEEIEKLRNE